MRSPRSSTPTRPTLRSPARCWSTRLTGRWTLLCPDRKPSPRMRSRPSFLVSRNARHNVIRTIAWGVGFTILMQREGLYRWLLLNVIRGLRTEILECRKIAHALGEQHAVEVIDLVLQRAAQQAAGLANALPLAVEILVIDRDPGG